jgi:DNA-binding response OmpR family regulator
VTWADAATSPVGGRGGDVAGAGGGGRLGPVPGVGTGDGNCVVVVEDDHHISDLVAMYLRRDGFRVLQADDAETGLELVERERPALVVLDIGLPGRMDGLEACRALRAGGDTAVLMLTARDEELDRVLGLELGADDYVTKPFSPRELVARVRAILRRTAVSDRPPAVHRIGELEVDSGRREVRGPAGVVALTAREFDLLAYLAAHPGLVLSRRQLLDGAWGSGWYGDERTVDVHVRQLRKKLGDALPLTTVWGVGYRLD